MRGFLGLGSNVGDRLANLRSARAGLELTSGTERVLVVASSPVYETAPQGEIPDQPDFLNACLEIDTGLGPEPLLELCKRLEARLGRTAPARRHAPRTIDLDVLLLGETGYCSPRLTLPHPEILVRRFVLQPLLDLDPALTLPGGGRLADSLPGLGDQRVERVAGEW